MRGRDTHGSNTVAKRAQRLATIRDRDGRYPTTRAAWLAVVAHAYRNGYAAGRGRVLYAKAKRKGRR